MSSKDNTAVAVSERRRKAAVDLGRQQIRYMELERELERARGKIQHLQVSVQCSPLSLVEV